MYEINPCKKGLVQEFRASPFGRHGPELQYLLNRLRWVPLDQRYILICRRPKQEWVLALLTGNRGEPVRILADKVFTSKADAEWEVFKIRWRATTGEELQD